MSADKIVEKIISDARAEAQRILDDARREADHRRAWGEEDADRVSGPLLQRAKVEAERRARMHLSLAQLAARNEILAARRKALDQVFEEAYARIARVPDKDYLQFLTRLLVRSAPQGDEEIIVSTADRAKLDSGFLQSVNQDLKEAGKKGNLRLAAETRELGGGLMLKSNQYEVALTFSMLLRQARERLETEVARILFAAQR